MVHDIRSRSQGCFEIANDFGKLKYFLQFGKSTQLVDVKSKKYIQKFITLRRHNVGSQNKPNVGQWNRQNWGKKTKEITCVTMATVTKLTMLLW